MLTNLRERAGEADRLSLRAAVTLGSLLTIGILAISVLSHPWRAATLLQDTIDPPGDISDRVTVQDVSIRPDLTARLYRSVHSSGPEPAFIVIHGAIGQGPDDPRLVDLSRSLAARGATVLAPNLESLSRFRLDDQDPARVAAAIDWLAGRSDLASGGRVAVFGISIGGSYGLLAAGDESVADQVSAVMVFGGYHDLGTLLTQWLTDPVDTPTVLDPLREGRRLVLLGNVEKAVDASDVDEVTRCLEALLDGAPCELDDPLGDRARLVIEAAQSETALTDQAATELLAPLSEEIAALSPRRLGTRLDAPVYLLHAVNDPVVPTRDSELVAEHLAELGSDVTVHITEVFEHVDTETRPSLIESWPLAWFVGRFLDDAGF